MQKILSFLLGLALIIAISACNNQEKLQNSKELGNFLTEKMEQHFPLTEEQKTKIVQLTEASGIMKDGVRTSDDEEKIKALYQQVYSQVLTPEQQAKFKMD